MTRGTPVWSTVFERRVRDAKRAGEVVRHGRVLESRKVRPPEPVQAPLIRQRLWRRTLRVLVKCSCTQLVTKSVRVKKSIGLVTRYG